MEEADCCEVGEAFLPVIVFQSDMLNYSTTDDWDEIRSMTLQTAIFTEAKIGTLMRPVAIAPVKTFPDRLRSFPSNLHLLAGN